MLRARHVRRAPWTIVAAILCAPIAAQEPRLGKDWYEDRVEFGFRIKAPKDWQQIPSQPDQRDLLIRYSAEFNNSVSVGQGQRLEIVMMLAVLDERIGPQELDGDADVTSTVRRKTVLEWIERRVPFGQDWHLVGEKKELTIKGVERAETSVFEATHKENSDARIRMFVAEYRLQPGLRICLLGNGPSDRKWKAYEKAWTKIARSFSRVRLDERIATPSGATARERKRSALETELARLDGWRLLETENYFIISDVDDDRFLDELMEKIEAIRAVYTEQYPPERARSVYLNFNATAGGAKTTERASTPTRGSDKRQPPGAAEPPAASPTSVVRVCSSASMYQKYGGPPRSAGYWNSATQELVVFDDQAGGGRRNTWITLNHEAFHQYIFYFYGAVAPHSWYNEGTGDFYSGYTYKHKRFKLKENAWRIGPIRSMLSQERYAPLRSFVNWTQSEYYGNNALQIPQGDCYAQGWSFIYFLRTGPTEKPRGWKGEWNGILDTYLESLAMTGDLDHAVETAFHDVDWNALEQCWKRYVSSL